MERELVANTISSTSRAMASTAVEIVSYTTEQKPQPLANSSKESFYRREGSSSSSPILV